MLARDLGAWQLGVALPEQVIKIFWVIVVLLVILLLYRTLGPSLHVGRIF